MEKKVSARKELKLWVYQTLALSMDKLRDGMNDKKYKRSIKEATKILMEEFNFPKKEKKIKKAKKIKSENPASL